MQHLINTVNNALEKGLYVLSIFIDFKKACDTVVFSRLLNRLSGLGIRGTCLKWFESYLRGRKLSVCIEHKKSSIVVITCGVPQGSILGPLLYLIYVDSMRFCVVGLLTSFADDTAILVIGKTVQELRQYRGLHSFVSESLLAVNAKKRLTECYSKELEHTESCRSQSHLME